MVLTSIALVLLAVSAYSQQILPASYLSPYDSGWNDILAAGPAKVPIALVNPNSGPGAGQYDSHVLAFKALTQRLQAAGIKVFGYSDTSYTRVPVSRVLSEIDNYYAWMGVDGIFLDQTPGDCSLTWYYKQIYDKIKGYGGQALLNPGAPSAECYMAVGDIHLTAEIDYNYYVNSYQTASWVWKYPSTRFYHIAYNVPQSAIKSVVQLARNRNAGYVFFTNLGLPNPYGTLPSYWAAHVSALVLPTPTQTTEAPSSKAPEPTTKAPEPTTKAPMPTTTPPTLPPTQAPTAAATQPPSSATSAPDSPANSTLPPSEAPATEAPLVSRIAAVSNPTFSAQLGAPATVPANELVWQSLVLAVNTPGTYLLLGITSHAAFSLTKQVHIFLSADDAGSPSVTIKGDRAYSASGREIYRLAEPADGTSMTLAVPLSLFSPRPRTIHVYGISAQNGVRIPETGSINVSLPALMAHIFFQYEAPAAAAAADPSALALLADDSNALKDTGAVYSDKVDANGQRLGFSYGWSAEPAADSTEGSCVAFSDRSWQIAVPDSGFYRVRAVLSTPSPGSCVSLSVGDTALGHVCNDGVNTALNPIHERTVLINGDSLMLWQTSNATLPLPADPAQRLCELLVTAATGIVMETTLDTDSADAINVEVLEAALASLTGETAHRFTVIGHSVNLTSVQTRQDSAPAYGRVTFAYLIADEKLSSSPVPASDLSAKLQAAGETDWANSGPYRSVTSNLVATGSVPASYMPESTGPATPAAPTKGKRSSKTGLVVGLVVGLICAALLVAAAVFVLYPAPIWKRDNRWMHSFLPAALKPTSNPVPVESSDSVAAPTSSSNLASAELGSPINSHTVLV